MEQKDRGRKMMRKRKHPVSLRHPVSSRMPVQLRVHVGGEVRRQEDRGRLTSDGKLGA